MYYEWFEDNSLTQAVYFVKITLHFILKIGVQTEGPILA